MTKIQNSKQLAFDLISAQPPVKKTAGLIE
jgi:hypothetical protein